MKKLFIGKLSLSTTDSALRDLFSSYEPIKSVKIITDKFSGDSRGFAFVEIDNDDSAGEAIIKLNGAMLDGQAIVVNEARPASDKPRSSFSGRSNFRDSGASKRSNYRPSNTSRY